MKNPLAAAAFAVSLAFAGPALAQVDLNVGVGGNAQITTPDVGANVGAGGNINAETVLPERPFGNLAISTEAGADLRGQIDKLNDEQRAELRARCDVIAQHPDRYSASVTAACSAM